MRRMPRLMQSSLLGRIYIVTRYDDLGDGEFLAKEKFDVTDEFNCMALKWVREKGAGPAGADTDALRRVLEAEKGAVLTQNAIERIVEEYERVRGDEVVEK